MRLGLKISIFSCLLLAFLFSTGLSYSIFQVKNETAEIDKLVRDFLVKSSQGYVDAASKNLSTDYQENISITELKPLLKPLKDIDFNKENTRRVFTQLRFLDKYVSARIIYKYTLEKASIYIYFTLKKEDDAWLIKSFRIQEE